MIKKGLVLSIVVLLIGVVIVPSITGEVNLLGGIQQESPDIGFKNEELIEITVKIIDVDKVQEHTVMLTQQQSDELNIMIDNYKIDLGIADTMEETKEVYLDMIESLYNLGIYPDEMSIEDVSQIIFDDKHQFKDDVNSKSTYGENKNCLISGETTWTYFGIFWRIGIGLHAYDVNHDDYYNFPGEGWVDTSGEMGDKRWEGSLWGNYLTRIIAGWHDLGWHVWAVFKFDLGVRGFKGTTIVTDENDWTLFYQGKALAVRIGYSPHSSSYNKNQAISNQQSTHSLFMPFLERFPILQRLLYLIK